MLFLRNHSRLAAFESLANPGGQYSELAVLALRWAMAFRITGFGKTISAQRNFKGLHFCDKSRKPSQDAQKVQTSHPPNPGGYFTRPP